MGCRKDKDARGIAEAAQKVLDRSGFHKEAFEQIASIDLKKEEKGILSLSQDWQIPFVTYTEEELKQVPGEFTPSPFVKKITGVDNVCERSAVLASGNGRLRQRKTGENGVTGKNYKVVLEYFQAGGEASLKFDIGIKKEINYKEVADKAAEADAIIFVGGLSPTLEGEEMPVDLPGFRKGDRTNIDLPHVQAEMLKALKKTGKPVIFVLCSGSTLALPWEAENLDAILEAWYPGQQGGTAVADVLFGDYNPAGRLPLTFYASSDDLPDFEDYDMSNRTYRYFKGKALFPFGHGLSYTIFDYGKAKVDKQNVRAGEGMTLTIPLKNTGKLDGDEVIQVYLRNPADKEGPIKTLRAFRRVSLPAGQTENIRIELPASTFECFNPSTNRMEILPGKYELLYGGTSDEKALQKLTITVKK